MFERRKIGVKKEESSSVYCLWIFHFLLFQFQTRTKPVEDEGETIIFSFRRKTLYEKTDNIQNMKHIRKEKKERKKKERKRN